jgi:CheY-like chemotaxis protein
MEAEVEDPYLLLIADDQPDEAFERWLRWQLSARGHILEVFSNRDTLLVNMRDRVASDDHFDLILVDLQWKQSSAGYLGLTLIKDLMQTKGLLPEQFFVYSRFLDDRNILQDLDAAGIPEENRARSLTEGQEIVERIERALPRARAARQGLA